MTPTRHALLFKLGAIGDVVMLIPAARALADAGWRVTWVVGPAAAPLLRLYSWIETVECDEPAILRGGTGARVRALRSRWRRLPRGRVDLCATLYFDRRYRLLSLPVRARRRVALQADNRAYALLPGRHHTDEYARILLGLPDEARPRQLAPVAPPTMPATPLARTSQPRIVLAPGGAKNLLRDDAFRRWPVESYVDLARQLLARGFEVVLSGGPGDTWVSPHFTGVAVQDAIGRFSLTETLGLFDSADVVCTHDSGPLHLAGLTAAGLVGIFGPVDPHGRLPQRSDCLALWGGEGFACRPCYDGRDYAPCPRNLCMEQVTPSMVAREIETLWRQRKAGISATPRVRVPKRTLLAVEELR